MLEQSGATMYLYLLYSDYLEPEEKLNMLEQSGAAMYLYLLYSDYLEPGLETEYAGAEWSCNVFITTVFRLSGARRRN